MDKGLPLVLLTNYPSQTGQVWRTALPLPVSMYLTACFIPCDGDRRFPASPGRQESVCGGEGALIHELYKAGFTITDVNLIL